MSSPSRLCLAALFATLASLASAPACQAAFVTLQNATATFSQAGFTPNETIDGIITTSNGWAISPEFGSQTAVWEVQGGSTLGGSLTFTLTQSQGTNHTLGRFRLSATTDDRSLFADGLASGGDVIANWTVLDPTTFSATGGATLTEQGDFSILASGTNPSTSVYTVTVTTALSGITGFRLEAMEDPSLPSNGPGRQPTNGNFVLTEFSVDGTQAELSAVPAPPGAVLFALGVACLGLTRRFHRPAAA